MCLHYDPSVTRQCREDDAEEVLEKERANFCEWFRPNPAAYDPAKGAEARTAEEALNALFSDSSTDTPDAGTNEAEDLFK